MGRFEEPTFADSQLVFRAGRMADGIACVQGDGGHAAGKVEIVDMLRRNRGRGRQTT